MEIEQKIRREGVDADGFGIGLQFFAGIMVRKPIALFKTRTPVFQKGKSCGTVQKGGIIFEKGFGGLFGELAKSG